MTCIQQTIVSPLFYVMGFDINCSFNFLWKKEYIYMVTLRLIWENCIKICHSLTLYQVARGTTGHAVNWVLGLQCCNIMHLQGHLYLHWTRVIQQTRYDIFHARGCCRLILTGRLTSIIHLFYNTTNIFKYYIIYKISHRFIP